MSDERENCPTCGRPLPPSDGKTGADVANLLTRAGVDVKTLAEHLGEKPTTLARVVSGKGKYRIGLYARAEEACRSIVSSRAMALGLFPGEQ